MTWDDIADGGGEEDGLPLTVRIRGRLPELQPAMRRVGEFIVARPSKVAGMTISALAEAVSTSETTVIRFCREIGVKGYAQLRLALAVEAGARTREDIRSEESADIAEGDDIASVVEKIAYADARSVADTAKALSLSELSAVVTRIAGASRTEVYGVGASGIVGTDLQQKLHRIGLVSFAFTDPHQAVASATLLDATSVAIGVSHSGTTTDTIDTLRVAKGRGATTVAITNVPGSALAELADFTLLTAARETTFRAGATGSRLAQLTVVDCLFVAVAQQTFDRSITALEETRLAAHRRNRTN